jgi:hypothetical protein
MAPIARGLAAWYRGEGNANDASGNGNNGSWGGTEAYAAGKLGRAFDFDGTNYLSRDALISGAFSVVAWVRLGAARQNAYVASQTDVMTAGRMFFGLNGAGLLQFVINPTTITVAEPAANTWAHIAATRASNTAMALYLNAVSVATGAQSNAVPNTSFDVGGTNKIGSRNVVARIDEVMVFNRALSAREIRDGKEHAAGYNESVIGAQTTLKTLGRKLRESTTEESVAIIAAIMARSGRGK